MGDQEKAEIIMALDVPHEIKNIGKHVQNFNAERWEEACQAIVERGNMEKVYHIHLVFRNFYAISCRFIKAIKNVKSTGTQ